MSEIHIRPSIATDLPILMQMDHSNVSDYVWQMDLHHEATQVDVSFRKIRLPHSVKYDYPRNITSLADEWSRRSGILVATQSAQPVGYIRINDRIIRQAGWVTDLVVNKQYRNKGIGTLLICAGQSWIVERKLSRVILELSSKCFPGLSLAQKLGYEFCGYNDKYYLNNDIALFFGKTIR